MSPLEGMFQWDRWERGRQARAVATEERVARTEVPATVDSRRRQEEKVAAAEGRRLAEHEDRLKRQQIAHAQMLTEARTCGEAFALATEQRRLSDDLLRQTPPDLLGAADALTRAGALTAIAERMHSQIERSYGGIGVQSIPR